MKCCPVRWLLASALWAVVFTCDVHATVYDLYYLGGQSNMDGYGSVEDLPTDLLGTVSGVMIFHGNTSPDGAPVDGRGVWSELRPGHEVGYSSDGTTATYSDPALRQRRLHRSRDEVRRGDFRPRELRRDHPAPDGR